MAMWTTHPMNYPPLHLLPALCFLHTPTLSARHPIAAIVLGIERVLPGQRLIPPSRALRPLAMSSATVASPQCPSERTTPLSSRNVRIRRSSPPPPPPPQVNRLILCPCCSRCSVPRLLLRLVLHLHQARLPRMSGQVQRSATPRLCNDLTHDSSVPPLLPDMNLPNTCLNGIIGNAYECNVLKMYLERKGWSIKDFFRILGDELDRGSLSAISHGVVLTSDTITCFNCAQELLRKLAYDYRLAIPSEELPVGVGGRPDCYWGKECRTQYRNPTHARYVVGGASNSCRVCCGRGFQSCRVCYGRGFQLMPGVLWEGLQTHAGCVMGGASNSCWVCYGRGFQLMPGVGCCARVTCL